jgi:hypothetical protein
MDGFELCKKILELDVNVRVCFMTAEVKSWSNKRNSSFYKYRVFYKKASGNGLFG